MRRYSSARIEINGRVFVEITDIEERLQQKFPAYKEKCDADEDGNTSAFDLCTFQEQQETFEELARERINAIFPTDDPVKMNEFQIDLSTYRSSK